MTRRTLILALAAPLLAGPLASGAAAEPMKGRYELRCQDPATRQWAVTGQLSDPEIVEKPGEKPGGKPGGGREVRGTGPDGKPVVLPMPADRTCMLSAR
ncbi:hypothetical protein [Azospirillum sp. TSO35-2]|uniref:hypothetical protein n=1 Tax=Azospirillum sp. TSO35-2 TaxID=716796 RepID=UPI000D60CEAC|nr:hypothetical protein [Azospirillum sp. TSO35-2]PWC40618.1 hypothetical protein TSO352_00725 [Azospirillum sp. TSO35-2]